MLCSWWARLMEMIIILQYLEGKTFQEIKDTVPDVVQTIQQVVEVIMV